MKALKYLNKSVHEVADGGIVHVFKEGTLKLIPDNISESTANYLVYKHPLSFSVVDIDEKPEDIKPQELETIEPDFELAEHFLNEDTAEQTVEVDYETFSLSELKAKAREKGLPDYGSKSALIKRITKE
jgi:hypothetical protein